VTHRRPARAPSHGITSSQPSTPPAATGQRALPVLSHRTRHRADPRNFSSAIVATSVLGTGAHHQEEAEPAQQQHTCTAATATPRVVSRRSESIRRATSEPRN
jgi:hypothetical protein